MAADANLASMLGDAARARPAELALWCAGRSLSWSEADAAATDLSAGLRSLGLQPGDRLGLLLGNSIEFVLAYFGALRAGLVVVPMNPAYTGAEVAVLLAEAGVRAVLCEPATGAVAREAAEAVAGCEVIEVGTAEWEQLLAGGPMRVQVPVEPGALGLLLFTAGTSGRPKGAMLTHGALRANIDSLRQLTDPPPVLPGDVVYAVLPMFHVYGLNTVLGLAVSAGAACIIADRFEPREALRLISERGVTTVAGAPAMYRAWAALPEAREALAGVRLFSSGGSPLPTAVFDAFAESTGAVVYEGYGMTETSPVVTTTLVAGRPKPGSVGRAIPGVQIRLVDPDGQEADDGDTGEVCVRGPGVFLGYWPDGAGGPDADGWFRSGDVAFLDADGDLHLVDRRRELVLVNGFNVYPREIELAIESMDGIEEVAVVGIPDDATGEALMAFVVARPGVPVTAEQVRDHCAGRLARFKLPATIRMVQALPHSATGKVAKGRLREVHQDASG